MSAREHAGVDPRKAGGALSLLYADKGAVERLAIDFAVHCENFDPIFSGAVRIQSEAPLPGPRPPTPTPRPDNFVLQIESEPGDPIGGGATYAITAATAPRYGAQHYFIPWAYPREHVSLYPDPDQTWLVILAAPHCSGMVPGTYENAGLAPDWLELARPEIAVSHQPYRCYAPGPFEGRFVVHEAQYGEFGEVYRFAADFEQRCGDVEGRLKGSVRFISNRPTPIPQAPTPTPNDYSSMAVLYSEPGDFIGACRTRVLTLAEGDFSATRGATGLFIVFDGGANYWSFGFAAPAGQDLLPGSYPDAERLSFQGPDKPGLDINGIQRGCSRVTGSFTVLEADFGAAGEVRRFAADFVQHCEGGSPRLFGTVRFRSSLPPPTLRPADAPSPTPELERCWGDRDHNGQVTVDEIVLALNVALGRAELDRCQAADGDRDGSVTINDIITAVGHALTGCR